MWKTLTDDPHWLACEDAVWCLLHLLGTAAYMLWRDETMEPRQDNDEKQQVRALLCVLDKVWGLKLFCCAGDVTAMLLYLLRHQCWETLEGDGPL